MAVPGKLNNELSDLSRHRVVAILEAKLCYCRFKARNELGDIFWLKRLSNAWITSDIALPSLA